MYEEKILQLIKKYSKNFLAILVNANSKIENRIEILD